nr:uncharacterized protein LOC129484193 isoform X2 [Symphalangus syndactylus]
MHPTCWTEPLLAFLNPEKSPGSRMKQRVPGTHTGLATTREICDDCPHSPGLGQGCDEERRMCGGPLRTTQHCSEQKEQNRTAASFNSLDLTPSFVRRRNWS